MNNTIRRKMAALIGVTAVALGTVETAHRSLAQNNVDEIAVQGRSADGGDQYHIVGNSQRVRFSLTGRRADISGVTLAGQNRPLFEATIQQIIDGATPIKVEDIQRLSDGRTRIFCRIDNPIRSVFNNSQVRLRAGNYLFDSDPVTIR